MELSLRVRPVGGFSVTELMVTVGIVLLVIAIAVPSYETFRERARKAKCISHLRNIHGGLLAYITEVGHWPQLPESGELDSEETVFLYWSNLLDGYGVGPDSWVCPSDRRLVQAMGGEKRPPVMGSYVVSRFGDKAQDPFRYNQPWALERGGFHRGGPHILLPDGSVQSVNNPFFGR